MSLNRYAPLWVGLAALAVAYLLAWGLSPADPVPGDDVPAAVSPAERSERTGAAEPGPATAESRIGTDTVERATSYRAQSRRIALAGLLLQFVTLGLLAFYRGPPMRAALDRLARRPLAGAAAAGFSLVLILTLVRLPLSLAGFDLARDFGLVTQPRGEWLADLAISTLITASLAAAGATVAMALWRRLGNRFWIAASVLVAVWAVVVVWLWPVVVSPVFNSFDRLPPGQVRSDVERLADRAGVDVGEVYAVDASRRSTTLNAYVNGIASSKRVVIYDNAINRLSRAELSALIAHELGHVEANDLYRGLLYAILVIPLGVLFVQVGTKAAVGRSGDDPAGPGIVPALALMTAVATLMLSLPGNLLSRSIETRADRYTLALISDPDALIGLHVQLARANLSDPDPPGLYQFLFGSHPPTGDRIEEAASRPGAAAPEAAVSGSERLRGRGGEGS